MSRAETRCSLMLMAKQMWALREGMITARFDHKGWASQRFYKHSC